MTLNGYDISSYQSALNPAAIPGDFVIIKATGGDGYVNPSWRNQIAQARAAGKLVGIYHFARDGYTSATAASEANWFVQNAADVLDGTVLAVLDWEGDNVGDVGYAKAWLDQVTASTGVKPLLYASYATVTAYDWSSVANANYGLWESAYVLGGQRIDGYNPPGGLAAIPYWSTRAMWQYTSTGFLPGWGAALDLDIFYGDATTWAAYAAKNGQITAQASTATQLGDFLMALSDAEQRDLYNSVVYIASAKFKADIFAGTTDVEKGARESFCEEIVSHDFPWYGFDGKVPASGRTTTNIKSDLGMADTRGASWGNYVAAKVASLPAGQATDPAAIAAAVKAALPADLAHAVAVEFGKLLNPPAAG